MITEYLTKKVDELLKNADDIDKLNISLQPQLYIEKTDNILKCLTNIQLLFYRLCDEQYKNEYKLCNYAIEQTEINKKFLESLISIIEINGYDKMYDEYIEQLYDYQNIVKFKSILFVNISLEKYIELNFEYIKTNTFILYDKKFMPLCINNGITCHDKKTPIIISTIELNYIYVLNEYILNLIKNPLISSYYKSSVVHHILYDTNKYHTNYILGDKHYAIELYKKFNYIHKIRFFIDFELISFYGCKIIKK